MTNKIKLNISKEDFKSLTPTDLETKIYKETVSLLNKNNNEEFIKSLSQGIQMIYSTLFLEGQVYNGGFNQYFWNAPGYMPEIAEKNYKLLGANKIANLVEEAVTMFMHELPKNMQYLKENTRESFVESYKHTNLGTLDKKFYKLVEEENISSFRYKYILSHKEDFIVFT